MGDLSKLSVPSVYINGTSKSDLMRNQTRIIESLRSALHNLRVFGPHDRDFVVQEAGAWRKAEAEHQARIDAVAAVLAEQEYIQEKIEEQ